MSTLTQATAETLNALIEFDSPFTVDSDSNITGAKEYAPRVENSETNDIEIDSTEWEAFSVGYTGQYGYNGAVMHASEQLSGRLADDVLSTPGTYVITAVEVNCEVDNPDCGSPYDRATNGCDCFPAGWIVLKLNES